MIFVGTREGKDHNVVLKVEHFVVMSVGCKNRGKLITMCSPLTISLKSKVHSHNFTTVSVLTNDNETLQ